MMRRNVLLCGFWAFGVQNRPGRRHMVEEYQRAKQVEGLREASIYEAMPERPVPEPAMTKLSSHVRFPLYTLGRETAIQKMVWGKDDWLGQQFDASILSDEATAPGQPNFTGAFVGMACEDLAGTLRPADFDSFECHQRSHRPNPFSASSW